MRILVQGTGAHSRRRVETGRSATARRRRSPSEPRIVDPEQVEAAKRNVQQMIQEALALLPNVPAEVRIAVLSSDPVRLAYFSVRS